MSGYIKVHRSLFESELWTEEPFTKGQAWIDLIAMANFTERQIIARNSFITTKRGDVLTTERELAARWKWSKTKVRSFLVLLERAKMVAIKKPRCGTLISIENYGKYQDAGNKEKTKEKTTEKTTEKPKIPPKKTKERPPTYYIKKEKNEKNVYNSARAREAYGEFNNVILSESEHERLIERFPTDYQERIEGLSEYIASRDKVYKSHYATILAWARRDEKKADPDKPVSFMEL